MKGFLRHKDLHAYGKIFESVVFKVFIYFLLHVYDKSIIPAARTFPN